MRIRHRLHLQLMLLADQRIALVRAIGRGARLVIRDKARASRHGRPPGVIGAWAIPFVDVRYWSGRGINLVPGGLHAELWALKVGAVVHVRGREHLIVLLVCRRIDILDVFIINRIMQFFRHFVNVTLWLHRNKFLLLLLYDLLLIFSIV